MQAEISEIFSSIQGEGFYLGARQVFVRFGRCNMHCHYCDELPKMQKGEYRKVSTDSIVREILDLDSKSGPHHSVSFTGGEPFMYPEAFAEVLRRVKSEGLCTYVETNGTYPEALKRTRQNIDILSIDLKPESSSKDRGFWEAHADFLRKASGIEGYVKVVVTPETTDDDIFRCLELVRKSACGYRMVLQPVSSDSGPDASVTARLESLREKLVSEVHGHPFWIIPQIHKIFKVR